MNRRKLFIPVISGGVTPWYQAGGAPLPLAVYVGKGAASLAASLVNQITPGTHDLTAGAAVTLQAGGWLADGTAYLASDIVPALTYTIICRVSGQNDANRAFLGVQTSATQNFYIRHVGVASQSQHVNGGQSVYTANGFRTAGVFAMAGRTTFIDGVQGNTITTGGTNPTHALWLMGLNNAGSLTTQMTQGNLVAVAVYNSTLTPAQVTAVSAAMAAL